MVPRVFFLAQLAHIRLTTFTSFWAPMTPPPPPLPPGGRRLTLYALDPIRKWGYAALGVGRWHIITQAAGQQGVLVRVLYAPMCICVYCSCAGFCGPRPARGDRSDPTTLDFLGQTWRRNGGGREKRQLLPKSFIIIMGWLRIVYSVRKG